jgi:hypothetical protein
MRSTSCLYIYIYMCVTFCRPYQLLKQLADLYKIQYGYLAI